MTKECRNPKSEVPDQARLSSLETMPLVHLPPSGLHVRCPHCQNQVEFLEEHEQSDIKCATCGSVFSIVNSAAHTRHASALQTVGNFELVTRLGIGSFGAVWKAYDPQLDRSVAVKIPRRGQLDALDEIQFLREARVAAQLRHPNIVSVHEVGREGDTLYIVSDLIRGVPLSELLTVRRFTTVETIELCSKVAGALQHAHERGVVHRDLKPSNIMMDEQGEPHLTDFGLAKRDAGELTMTADGQILGTPAYMSPEQAAGAAHHVDSRSDIYSLGVLMFEMLTGELPFRGSAQLQMHQKMTDDPPHPRSLERLVPPDLDTICLKCIQRDPNQRYPSAKALLEDLQRFADGRPILARPISWVEQGLRWVKRHPWPATAAALISVLAIGGPLAAWRIEDLRRDSIDFYTQRELAYKTRDAELDAARKEIQQLEDRNGQLETQLGVWEGGTDPSEFWPPYSKPPLFEGVLQELVSDEAYIDSMLEDSEPGESQAFVQLALAASHEALHHEAEAIEHYKAARVALTELMQNNSSEASYARALADCLVRLSELEYESDRESAVAHLQEAGSIRRRLASQSDRLPLQAELLEAEMRLTQAEGSKAAERRLVRAGNIHRQLLENKPTDPQKLYELICFLSGRPLLLDSAAGD